MAPATSIDRAIDWEAVDARTVNARFTNAGHTIHATLAFDDAGMLTNFVSDDRYQSSIESPNMRKLRWSTPVSGPRAYGPIRVLSAGEARWQEPGGEYAYIQLAIDDIQYNVGSR